MKSEASRLRFTAERIGRRAEGPARLELDLFRGQYPEGAQEVFQPLRLPDRCHVRLCGPLLRCLQGAKLQATCHLRSGLYNLPLGAGTPCQLELLSEARAILSLEIEAPGSGGPLIRDLRLRFDPPLTIYNVLQTLTQLHELVEEKHVAVLKSVVPRLPSWMRQLGEMALVSADGVAAVLLDEISAHPCGQEGEPTLRFRFSGHVRWLDQAETRFVRLALPSTLLPLPHALLERLLGPAPLATAEIVAGPDDWMEMIESLFDAVDHVEGELSLKVDPPPVEFRTRTLDGTEVQVEGRVPVGIELKGAFAAAVSGTQVEVRAEEMVLAAADGSGQILLDLRASGSLVLDGQARPLRERIAFSAEAEIKEQSHWAELLLDGRAQETITRGESSAPLRLRRLDLAGGACLSYDGKSVALQPVGTLTFRGDLESRAPFSWRGAKGETTVEIESRIDGSLRPLPEGPWLLGLRLDSRLQVNHRAAVPSLPELDIAQGMLEALLSGRLELEGVAAIHLSEGHAFRVDLAGTRARMTLDRADLNLEPRRIALPVGTLFEAQVTRGTLTATGLQGLALELHWDLVGQPCLLHHRERAVSLFTEELRRGRMTLLLEPSGKLTFIGDEEGLYGVRYFNTILNPAGDPEHLLELVLSEDAVSHVVAALSAFAPDLAEALSDIRALYLGARRILKSEGIRHPGDFVPRRIMARLFSLLLLGHTGLQERLVPILRRVTEGKGLDVSAAREILLQHLSEFGVDYEINALLHWLDLVLSPSDPLESAGAERELPVDLDPAYADAWQGLPSAREIYQAVHHGALDKGWALTLAELAPQLTRHQLGFILQRARNDWPPSALARLRYVYAVKTRVADIAECYGGAENALQPWTVASFLGEAVGPLPGINHPSTVETTAWPPPCAMGSEEVAVLLQAGLATGRQSRRSQINNRLLLELMRRRPPPFTREVFVELGHLSPRALSGILYAFLDQDQDQLAIEIDLVEFLSERLGIPIPRQRDFLAGGHKARQSYYDVLSRVADQILEESGPYLARKAHLQVMRQPVWPELILRPSLRRLGERARQKVARADELGATCSFGDGRRGGPRRQARDAYGTAFRVCAQLLQHEPRVFSLPWFKEFWLRNEEALKVLSVVRSHQEDLDQVRRWLSQRSGCSRFRSEQDLLEVAAKTLYARETHQRKVLADPLVRLLVDPAPGRFHFSVVSCMGVITDGKDGAELEDAYRRLEERRGVRVVRAHTGIARSLEYNAGKIIEAIESCTTPWGIIGYSQGCANALLAESILYGGTPEQQRLLEGLVCRNLLFSAANGSAHGTSGMIKFARALVEGERLLKHYQAVTSWEAITAVLRVVRAVLDSRIFVGVLGGAHSLSFERARLLHRDGQFLEGVPTSISRGVVSEDYLPETLEYLYYTLKELTRDGEQDTQVLVEDAVGHSTRVMNDYAAALARCDMTTFPLAIHHWAPLTREVEFVTTERDRRLAIYQGPKDLFVWPWIEVNARFGRIQQDSS